MADAYQIEGATTDRYLLEDGTGVLLLEGGAAPADDMSTRMLFMDMGCFGTMPGFFMVSGG